MDYRELGPYHLYQNIVELGQFKDVYIVVNVPKLEGNTLKVGLDLFGYEIIKSLKCNNVEVFNN